MSRPEYEGRYFLKEVTSEMGYTFTIKVDKVELTDYYQQIIHEAEIKIAREFTHNPEAGYPRSWEEDLQIPDYACCCDCWMMYYSIKKQILKDEYGIDYLSFRDLNGLLK